jgi:hypothetical protein
MSVFIQLTAIKRNGLPFAKSILVDVNKIINPIIENVNNNSIIEVDVDHTYSESYIGSPEKYEVDEDLAAINALSTELFLGTIVTQEGRPSLWPEALFVKSRIVGTVKEFGAVGESEFDYRLMAAKSPDTFIVSEDLATINA